MGSVRPMSSTRDEHPHGGHESSNNDAIMMSYLRGSREDGGQMETKQVVRFALRLPPDLHAALVELARREDRSLNQQLIRMLREGVKRDERRQVRATST